VIAVFTKYNEFRFEIERSLRLEDQDPDAKAQLHAEIDRVFNEHYLAHLKRTPPYICLENLASLKSEVSATVETHTELISLAQKSTKPPHSVMLSSN